MRTAFLRYIGALAALLVVSGAQAALVSILGGQAVYDTDLDISWVGDANLAASNTFGLATEVSLGGHPSDSSVVNGRINTDGTMNWPGALFWIDAMNAANYLGVNNWRLPITPQPDPTCSIQSGGDGSGFNCTGSEMGHLFNIEGVTSAAPSPFSNVAGSLYWSGTDITSDPISVWRFLFVGGHQDTVVKSGGFFAWAVRSGNLGVVPVPAAVWLFGSALSLLGWMRRKAA